MATYEIDWNDYHNDWEILKDGYRVDYKSTKTGAKRFAKRKANRGDRIVEYTKDHTFQKEAILGDDNNWLETDQHGEPRNTNGGLFGGMF